MLDNRRVVRPTQALGLARVPGCDCGEELVTQRIWIIGERFAEREKRSKKPIRRRKLSNTQLAWQTPKVCYSAIAARYYAA